MRTVKGLGSAVRLVRAGRSQRRIVENLVHFYVYDLAGVMGWPCPKDGMYRGCSDVPGYFNRHDNPRSAALLVQVGTEWAGFVLIDGHPKGELDYEIGQFFIVGKFRRRRVGSQVAREVFDRFRGRWQVQYLKENVPAVHFWREVIGRYTRGKFRRKSDIGPWGPKWVVTFSNAQEPVTTSSRRHRGAR